MGPLISLAVTRPISRLVVRITARRMAPSLAPGVRRASLPLAVPSRPAPAALTVQLDRCASSKSYSRLDVGHRPPFHLDHALYSFARKLFISNKGRYRKALKSAQIRSPNAGFMPTSSKISCINFRLLLGWRWRIGGG